MRTVWNTAFFDPAKYAPRPYVEPESGHHLALAALYEGAVLPESVAARLGCSDGTARRYLRELGEAGYARWVRRGGKARSRMFWEPVCCAV